VQGDHCHYRRHDVRSNRCLLSEKPFKDQGLGPEEGHQGEQQDQGTVEQDLAEYIALALLAAQHP